MLARLTALDGVAMAEVDHAGDLLRLTLDRDALAASLALLRDLGHEAEVEDGDGAPGTTVWYDAASVHELSFVEAGVISDRLVPRFMREHDLPIGPATLRAAVVSALHRCFTERALGAGNTGAFRQECVRSVVAAAAPIIGTPAAEALGALLEDDLGRDHRR